MQTENIDNIDGGKPTTIQQAIKVERPQREPEGWSRGLVAEGGQEEGRKGGEGGGEEQKDKIREPLTEVREK